MTDRRALFVWSAGALLCFSTAEAQVRATSIVRSSSGSVIISDDVGDDSSMQQADVPAPAQNAPALDKDKKDAKPSPRAEKLKNLEYDRRASSILKAWANPPKPPAPDKKEEKPEEKLAEQAAEPIAVADPAAVTEPVDPEAAKKAEEAAKKKVDAEASAKKSREEAAKKAAEAKAIEQELLALQRDVTLGDWAAMKTYFAKLTQDERTAGIDRMLSSLQNGVQKRPQVPQQGQQFLEKNVFAPRDLLGLADAAGFELSKPQLTSLGALLRMSFDQGHQIESFLVVARPLVDQEGVALNRRRLAHVLVGANEIVAAGEFLPEPEKAEKDNDREGLNLLARHYLARFDKDSKIEWLERAWRVTQAALAAGEVNDETKNEALTRAVDIAPKIKKELGQTWLDESFTQRPERGIEILASIGSSSSMGLQSAPMEMDKRFKWLELQTTAAKALLAAAPERASEWRSELGLLASNWLREAQFSYQYDQSKSLGPRMQRDQYGNSFWYDNNYNYMNQNLPAAIATGKILDVRPNEPWLAQLEPTLQPKFQAVFAQLYLKVDEEAKAFPFIESLAATNPKPAKDLADEFLRVWTRAHDPNSERSRVNRNMYFYGFEERASGIPLTRSKQERNLIELGEWLVRLRKLPVELDVALVANAFTTAHGVAEVYRLEEIEQIFGPMKDLKPATLAELLQKMRINLATVWRDPAQQEKSKTKRRPQDIQTEVLRGYELAHATLEHGLADHPDSWQLELVDAALRHDENNYAAENKKDPGFASHRAEAFASFQKAAALYAAELPTLEQEKETAQVYEMWFYAALGACELKDVDHKTQLAAEQIPLIRAAVEALPSERAKRHMDMLANGLFSRMSSAQPAVKYRYVRSGLELVGDNDLARECRQVFDYYKDLVTEIQLQTRIDGSDRVGTEPFGLCVNLRHTKQIERESGGFAKYLQNQNAANFSFNYGRPTEDYRDKFEEAAKAALKENFEVLSVTFNAPEAKSRAETEYGWRLTPYAYLLLKPRGPQVDRIPALGLDLDFLDTSGYAVLPIESAVLPIDASAPEVRPFQKVHLTQTLDERQAKDGKLLLEVKAGAVGLLPELESLVDFAPEGFDVVSRENNGNSVVKFDEESGTSVTAERLWTITLKGKEGLSKAAETFTFAKPRAETVSNDRFRYADADLVPAEETVSLERVYSKPTRTWPWWLAGGGALACASWFGWRRLQRPAAKVEQRYRVPAEVTPFTVLGLLREIERDPASVNGHRTELEAQIQGLERHYFGEEPGSAPDLEQIAQRWVTRVS